MNSNIIIPSPKKVKKFSKNIIDQGFEHLHILADFDRTITKAFVNGGEEVSSTISILRKEKYLKGDYSQKAYALFDKYHPIEINTSLPLRVRKKAMEEWWVKHCSLLISSGVNIKDIKKASKSKNINIRERAKEIFQLLNDHNVPIIILSASGLGVESIEGTLEYHGLSFPNVHVITNQFIWDKNGYAVDYVKPLIHTFNKSETVIKNFPQYALIKNRKNVILLGDSMGDIGMVDGFDYNNLLKIGFLNYEVEKNLEEFKKAYDIVLTHDASMEYVWDLLNKF